MILWAPGVYVLCSAAQSSVAIVWFAAYLVTSFIQGFGFNNFTVNEVGKESDQDKCCEKGGMLDMLAAVSDLCKVNRY